jgi:hypothetical protein
MTMLMSVRASSAWEARSGCVSSLGSKSQNRIGSPLDKTGTITEGRMEVTALVPADGVAEDELVRLASSDQAIKEHGHRSGEPRPRHQRVQGARRSEPVSSPAWPSVTQGRASACAVSPMALQRPLRGPAKLVQNVTI